MKATRRLHEADQGLWLDNITRNLHESGALAGYFAENSVTGLTSNPTIAGAGGSRPGRELCRLGVREPVERRGG